MRRHWIWWIAGAELLMLAPTLRDSSVNWRESYVLTVARNFCREDARIWLPRIDARDGGPGITGMEFPLLNWIEGWLFCRGAPLVLTARALALLITLAGVAAFGALSKAFLEERAAFAATLAFAFSPLVFYYGRVAQPDVPSMALAVVALFLLEAALPAGLSTRWGLYAASAIAMALAALVKLPAIVYGLPAVVLLYERRGARAFARLPYWSYVLLAVGPPAVWYAYARALQARYGLPYFLLGERPDRLVAAWLRPGFWWRIFGQSLFDFYAFPLASAVAVAAAFRAPRFAASWLIAAALFFPISGEAAAWHWSYGAVAVPAIALACGEGLQLVFARWPRCALPLLAGFSLATVGYGVWRSHRWFVTEPRVEPLEEAHKALDAMLAPRARIALFSQSDPKLFWYLDRKGWMVEGHKPAEWLAGHRDLRAVVIDAGRVPVQRREALNAAVASAGYRCSFDNSEVVLCVKPATAQE